MFQRKIYSFDSSAKLFAAADTVNLHSDRRRNVPLSLIRLAPACRVQLALNLSRIILKMQEEVSGLCPADKIASACGKRMQQRVNSSTHVLN